ncbi:MAG: hypothetical protein ACREHG_03775 [Candidatus Saccharimonadales bacterium]
MTDTGVTLHCEAMEKFLETQHYKRPSLMYIDEGHDFYGPTGVAKHSDVIQRSYRSGAERGMSTLLGTQRPKTINLQILTEANLLYLFHIAFREDLKRLYEMGVPQSLTTLPESGSHAFRFYRDDKLYRKPIRIKTGD